MIVECVECQHQYRLATRGLGRSRVYLRCRACGANFTLTLAENGETGGIQPPRALELPRPIVLSALRSEALRALAIDATAPLDLHTITVTSGESALRLLSQIIPRLVLVDSELEDVFCYEIIELIRSLPAFGSTHVMLLSEQTRRTRLLREPVRLHDADLWLDASDAGSLRQAINTLLDMAVRVSPISLSNFSCSAVLG